MAPPIDSMIPVRIMIAAKASAARKPDQRGFMRSFNFIV